MAAIESMRDMMLYDAQKKSLGVAYVLWFFFGGFGVHRFYAGSTGIAIAQLLLTVIGIATVILGIGFVLLGVVGIWILVDAFLLPSVIRDYNVQLAARLG
ncbi:TM2 domain-containing protein [Ralstonia pseudosolanacearum]|uniref:TM2 domain-containing protein n=1 Tax=Ralstonia pseudosolanacearum TaxID=1310165 RepID=UPI001FF86A87|nr:TM2 domain-containing protein [Ralstonia pseudosolanacearum]